MEYSLERILDADEKLGIFKKEPYLITVSIKKVFGFLEAASLGRRMFGKRNGGPAKQEPDKGETEKRAFGIDGYIVVWLFIEILFAFLVLVQGRFSMWFALLFGYRILDIFQSAVNISIFSASSLGHGDKVASVERMIVLAGVNFLELILCFGAIYAVFPNQIYPQQVAPVLGYYLSAVTQLTIGYGDVYPLSYLKVVAIAQGIINFIFVTLTISRFISSLRPMKAIDGDEK